VNTPQRYRLTFARERSCQLRRRESIDFEALVVEVFIRRVEAKIGPGDPEGATLSKKKQAIDVVRASLKQQATPKHLPRYSPKILFPESNFVDSFPHRKKLGKERG
jgi:hypothetical protein